MTAEFLGVISRPEHKSDHEWFVAGQVSRPVGKERWEAQGQSGLSPAGASGPPGSPDRPCDSADIIPGSKTVDEKLKKRT